MYKNIVLLYTKIIVLQENEVEVMNGNQIILWCGLAVIVTYLIYETFIAKPRKDNRR